MRMQVRKGDPSGLAERAGASEERLRLGEAAGGIATFELNLAESKWDWSPRAAALFGFDPEAAERSLETWDRTVFPDDLQKIHAAAEAAKSSGSFYVEFRVRHLDGALHWIAGKGQVGGNNAKVRLL